MKSFVKPFVDFALSLLDSSCNSFLFDVTLFNFSSKSLFFTKSAISILLAKYAGLSLAAKFSALNL